MCIKQEKEILLARTKLDRLEVCEESLAKTKGKKKELKEQLSNHQETLQDLSGCRMLIEELKAKAEMTVPIQIELGQIKSIYTTT